MSATSALVVVPALVLAEVDYFLTDARAAMRKLIGELRGRESKLVVCPR